MLITINGVVTPPSTYELLMIWWIMSYFVKVTQSPMWCHGHKSGIPHLYGASYWGVSQDQEKRRKGKKVSYIVGWIKLVWFGALYRLGPRWALFLEFLSSRFSFEVFVLFSLRLNLFQFVSQKRQIWSPPVVEEVTFSTNLCVTCLSMELVLITRTPIMNMYTITSLISHMWQPKCTWY